MIAALVVSIAGVAVSVILLIRNAVVYKARIGLLARVSRAARADIDRGDFSWQWRYDAYDSVSYLEMVLHFWRRPLSLYDDLRFANRHAREHEVGPTLSAAELERMWRQ